MPVLLSLKLRNVQVFNVDVMSVCNLDFFIVNATNNVKFKVENFLKFL